MNYLTNYYKNLCEQLQERINILQERINTPEEIREMGKNKMADAMLELRKKLGASYLSQEQLDQLADEHFMPFAKRAQARENLIKNATAELGGVAQAGDVKTAQQIGDVLADMVKPGSYDYTTGKRTKIAGGANLSAERAARENELSQSEYETRKRLRDMGSVTNVPADTEAMRAFIRAGRGKYQPPLSQPEGPAGGMHVTPQQY